MPCSKSASVNLSGKTSEQWRCSSCSDEEEEPESRYGMALTMDV